MDLLESKVLECIKRSNNVEKFPIIIEDAIVVYVHSLSDSFILIKISVDKTRCIDCYIKDKAFDLLQYQLCGISPKYLLGTRLSNISGYLHSIPVKFNAYYKFAIDLASFALASKLNGYLCNSIPAKYEDVSVSSPSIQIACMKTKPRVSIPLVSENILKGLLRSEFGEAQQLAAIIPTNTAEPDTTFNRNNRLPLTPPQFSSSSRVMQPGEDDNGVFWSLDEYLKHYPSDHVDNRVEEAVSPLISLPPDPFSTQDNLHHVS
jgi:hypothetical protein